MPPENVNANVVRARRFELVDEEDRVRAQLIPGANDAVELSFVEGGDTVRLSLGLNLEGTAVVDLRDESGSTRARLAVESSGTPTIFSIRDATNRIRAQIAMHEDAEGISLFLGDWTGDPRVHIAAFTNGFAEIALVDKDGNTVSGLSNESDV